MNDGGDARRGPYYFLEVQAAAKRRWQQLEADPELAGPWRQLFKQVQVPRHVLSELLQNADDAAATYASARIEDDTFVFEHDGEDFTKEQFESLCRFGFSNKRKLHTIGFRGIGFKSTFSLGKTVKLSTPTLSVKFNEGRFTEPVWIDDAQATTMTRICVSIEDSSRRAELCKNLEEWSKSPVSLLFFKNIRRLDILGHCVERKILGVGPVSDSEEIELVGKKTLRLTVFHSPEEPFPDDAIAEIRQEKISEDITFPACRVDLVMGLDEPQRLYVILPTEVCCNVPYSCNAPFIQDPARTGIKDPAISPTNRWLLKRIGCLAATIMISTLKNRTLPISKRAQAYELLPSLANTDSSASGEAVRLIRESFVASIPKDEILLTTEGDLYARERCVAPPYELTDIWTAQQLLAIFERNDCAMLASEVLPAHRKRLVAWEYLQVTSESEVLAKLESCGSVPRPSDWQCLVKLWTIIKLWTSEDWDNSLKKRLKIIPVEDSENLFPASDVIRLSSAKSRLSDDDWNFLIRQLHILDRGWVAHLLNRNPESPARQTLKLIGLFDPTPFEIIIVRAYQAMRCEVKFVEEDLMRLTAITAGSDVAIPAGFEYVARDGSLHKVESGLAADLHGDFESVVPKDYAERHLIHPNYFSAFEKWASSQWQGWIASAKSGLWTFVGFKITQANCTQRQVELFVEKHRGQWPGYFNQRIQGFLIKDRDFDPVLLEHWQKLAESDKTIWVRIVRLVLQDPCNHWRDWKNVQILALRKSSESAMFSGEFPAKWILRLREVACLEDTHGAARIPTELLIRTPETEALHDVEAFVRAEVDLPANRELLKLLGVRETPTNLDKLVDRLRALATIKEDPPLLEIANWYRRLDQILPKCGSEELSSVRKAFSSERLVLSSKNEWFAAGEIFLHADEEGLPGTPMVHPTVQPLSLWLRLGVADRPTLDLVLGWLKQLKSGSKLDAQNMKGVKSALQRCPARVWEECKHWLSLDGTWVPVSELMYRMTMAQRSRSAELFPGIRSQTADLRMLSMELCCQQPFSLWKNLGDAIEYRFTETDCGSVEPVSRKWMVSLGRGLRRIKLDDESETAHVRIVADRLLKTLWQTVKSLKVTPYISGTPAGQSCEQDVFWQESLLYVSDEGVVKFFDKIVEELSKPFASSQIKEIIRSCFEREDLFVEEYLRCNFDLEEECVEGEGDDVGGEGESMPIEPAGEVSVSSNPIVSKATDAAQEEPASFDQGSEELLMPNEAEEVQTHAPRAGPQRDKISLITEYAHFGGFRWDSEKDRYVHPNGSWLKKCDGCWERFSIQGYVQCRYWIYERGLLTEGIEISAASWELIKKNPTTAAVILRDDERQPLEITGESLVEKVRRGEIELYPSNYSLCLKPEIV